MKQTPLKRKNGVSKISQGLFDHIPKEDKNLFAHLDKESKDEEWERIREELKHRFAKVGILSCELQYEGCIHSYNFGYKWSFAHSLKREQIAPAKLNPELREIQMRDVIYACQDCHMIIEKLGNRENKMYDIVTAIKNSRAKQP
ncbi:hypothetical protein BH09PAT1_BH09PAT1_6540 [soil metagenome]